MVLSLRTSSHDKPYHLSHNYRYHKHQKAKTSFVSLTKKQSPPLTSYFLHHTSFGHIGHCGHAYSESLSKKSLVSKNKKQEIQCHTEITETFSAKILSLRKIFVLWQELCFPCRQTFWRDQKRAFIIAQSLPTAIAWHRHNPNQKLFRPCLHIKLLHFLALRREWGFAPLCGAAATFSGYSKDPSRSSCLAFAQRKCAHKMIYSVDEFVSTKFASAEASRSLARQKYASAEASRSFAVQK